MAEIDESKDLYICCAECIIEKEGKLLVIKRPKGVHAGGLFSFPGGKIEHYDGENGKNIFVEAAKREVLEEVGIRIVDPLQLVTSSFFSDEITGRPVVDCIFYCNAKNTETTVHADQREVPEYYWLTREELDTHPDAPAWVKLYIKLSNQIKL